MGSKKIVAAFLTLGLLAGCTMRTQAPTSITAHDFSDRDAYGQSFGVSPTYAGQDTSWTTSAPARAIGGLWLEKAPPAEAAHAKAKNADEGAEGKFAAASDDEQQIAAVPRPIAAPVARQGSSPVQRGQSTALPGAGTSGR
jgi:hypothetical protein